MEVSGNVWGTLGILEKVIALDCMSVMCDVLSTVTLV